MEFFPEQFAAMLHMSIRYNIPAVVRAVVEAANDSLAVVTDFPQADLDKMGCALEIARQIQTMWCQHAGTVSTYL